MNFQERLIEIINEIEAAHFRTQHDTGAAPQAMLVMNCFRKAAGLPPKTISDLPRWCESCKQYRLVHSC